MAADYVQVPPDGAGKKIQSFSNVVSGNTVEAQGVVLVSSAGVPLDPPSGTGLAVAGNVNSGSADSGSPVKVGGVFNTTLPTLTNGQRGDFQLDASARLVATLGDKSTVAQALNVTSTSNRTSLALQGAGTALVTITGNTWTGTLTFEAQGDGTNWIPVPAIPVNVTTGLPGTPVSSVTSPGATVQFLVPCAGYSALGVHCTATGSNTATVTIAAGVGSSATVGLVQGNVGAGVADAGAPVKVGGVFNKAATLPAYADGQRGDLQTDPSGTLKVGSAPLGTPVYGTSNGAAAANNVTLTIPAAKMGYLDGFDLDGSGATSGSAVAVTITGLLGGTLTFQVGIPAGATVPFTFSKRFNPPLQASAVATNIVVNAPSYGVGNLAASTNVFGHYV